MENLTNYAEKIFDSIMDSYVFYHGDCNCDQYNKCKHCSFSSEIYEKLKPNDQYIKKLEAQISRDRESLIKEGENDYGI